MTDTIKLYPAKPTKVYFYGTCLVDLFYPDAGLAGVQLLEREGIDVLFPQDQTCCGQPAFSSGFNDQARDVVVPQLDLFPGDWPIVVPAGSCGGMMRKHYPELFAGTPWQAKAEALASRVFELTDFLLNVCHIRLEDRGEPVRVAMHTSCSARREMGVGDVGPGLLAQLQQVEVVEQARATECCGFGGTFAVRHPEVSEAMVADKTTAIEEAGADTFLATDCGCMMNIAGYAEKQQRPLNGQHIASFLWQRVGGDA